MKKTRRKTPAGKPPGVAQPAADDKAPLALLESFRRLGVPVLKWLADALQAEEDAHALMSSSKKHDLTKIVFAAPHLIFSPRVQVLLHNYWMRVGWSRAMKRMKAVEKDSIYAAQLRRRATENKTSIQGELERDGYSKGAEAEEKRLRRILRAREDEPIALAWPKQARGPKKGTLKNRP